MNIDLLSLEEALEVLGQLLYDRESHHEVVAIGGGGLLLLGLISRPTQDLDLVARMENRQLISADPLPRQFIEAVQDAGKVLGLNYNWVNAGPASLMKHGLPEGFDCRMETRHYRGLTLHLASRIDQICFKLYAVVDHGPKSKHFADLKLLYPTYEELQFAREWCLQHDSSDGFQEELSCAIDALRGTHAE